MRVLLGLGLMMVSGMIALVGVCLCCTIVLLPMGVWVFLMGINAGAIGVRLIQHRPLGPKYNAVGDSV